MVEAEAQHAAGPHGQRGRAVARFGGHDPLRDRIGRERGHLRDVDDGDRQARSPRTGVGDRERAAGDLVGPEGSRPGAARDVDDRPGEVPKTPRRRVADDGNDEAAEVEVDGDAEVDRNALYQRVVADRRVHVGELPDGIDDRPSNEREIREPEALTRAPFGSDRAPHRLDAAVVDFAGDVRVRGRRLRREHVLRHPPAHRIERDGLGRRPTPWARRHDECRGAQNVVAGDPSVVSGSHERGGIDAARFEQLSYRRRRRKCAGHGPRRAYAPRQRLGLVVVRVRGHEPTVSSARRTARRRGDRWREAFR